MAQKTPVPTDEELTAMFEDIDTEPETTNPTAGTTLSSTTNTTKPTPSGTDDDDNDPLAELANLAATARLSSRPATPRISGSSATSRTRSPVKNTPPSTGGSGSARSSEEKADFARSGPSSVGGGEGAGGAQRSLRGSPAPIYKIPRPQTPRKEPEAAAGGGGWWGGLTSIASAAVKQAEAAVKEIQKNEEAQKWAEQVKGNYGALRGFGLSELRSRALPTFTNLIHTLAPPISQHERLQIHITHDLVGYPSLDPLIYQTFSRVMSQVEGGDLLVIQRGSESSQRRASQEGHKPSSGSTGWNDGPWWRDGDARNLGAVKGLVEGTRLVRVSAETSAADFFAARGGVEEAAKQSSAALSESNPVRSSDIFLAIQAISSPAPADHFASGHDAAVEQEETAPRRNIVVDNPSTPENLVVFAVYLHDPVHHITFSTISQPIPQKWADWLDARSEDKTYDDGTSSPRQVPEEIEEIIHGGGVDPREWVSEWMEELLSLAVGVVAQRYVARRMGVGEGGIGRGKRREAVVESGGGEAARAI